MNTYVDIFANSDDGTTFAVKQLESGAWVMNINSNKPGGVTIFMTDAQVKLMSDAIGKIYWNLDVPLELVDPEEEYIESV